MRFTLEYTEENSSMMIRCEGSLTLTDFTSDPLLELIGLEGMKRNVRLNLEFVDKINSSGIAYLVKANKLFRESGGKLILCNVPPLIKDVLFFSNMIKF